MSYFPMFIELKGRHCLIVGGGQTALHKAKVLADFGARLTVVAPKILPEIREMNAVTCREKYFEPEDVMGQELVVVATDDKEANHYISEVCKREHIPVNAVDQIEDCSFIFPAYIKEGEVVAAFSSGGQSPVVTQYLKERMRPILTGLVGQLAARLGDLRKQVQENVPEHARKYIYRKILHLGLNKGALPSEEEIEEIMGGKCNGQNEKA